MRFYEQVFAEGYESRLSRENYPGALLPAVVKHLGKIESPSVASTSVLDIGAGTGFFSLPLLKLGYKVSNLEPSGEMINIFQKKLALCNEDYLATNKLKIIKNTWKDFLCPSYDVLLSVHSIYPIAKNMDLDLALNLMLNKKNNKCIIVVRKKPQTDNLTDTIRKGLGIKKRISTAWTFSERIIRFLENRKVAYQTEDISQTINGSFGSLEEEALYYQMHLGIEDSQKSIENILEKHTRFSSTKYHYSFQALDTIIVF